MAPSTSSVAMMVAAAIFAAILESGAGNMGNWISNQKNYVANPPTVVKKTWNADYFANTLEDMDHFNRTLAQILVPRPSGSQHNLMVREFIKNSMEALGWKVELDSFEDTSNPLGRTINFANVIATLDERAPRRLVLACHYDALISPPGFLGATDSAVPCAQMINLAEVMKYELQNLKAKGVEVTLQMIFFDGEEAFKSWSSTDSLYGSRHLAARWADEKYVYNGVESTQLQRIDMLVLLDLLGAAKPSILATDQSTLRWYSTLAAFENQAINDNHKIFNSLRLSFANVDDDHVPFKRRGVPTLHWIALPFPSVWHTLDDDMSALHFPTIVKLNKILRFFVQEYLQLD